MNETKIILIRHGQSIGNLKRIFLGHADWDLSEEGYRQVKCVEEYLKNEKIDVFYSSDLKRAYNTVFGLASLKNKKITKSENLREIYAGKWEEMLFSEIETNFPDEFFVWKNDIGNARCVGGESVLELQKRVYDEIETIAKKHHRKTVCIGTHATAIRSFCAKCMQYSPDEIKNLNWAVNASISTLIYKDEKFNLIEYGYEKHLEEFSR